MITRAIAIASALAAIPVGVWLALRAIKHDRSQRRIARRFNDIKNKD